jgi:RNA polymerase sigma factor (sigma-70 family)
LCYAQAAREVFMLCQDCPFREECQSACEALEKDLASLEVYQRELLVSPDKLEYLAEAFVQIFEIEPDTELRAQNESERRRALERELHTALKFLSSEQREVIKLYFWRKRNIPHISKRLKINRSSVQRRLKRGLKALKNIFGVSASFYT